MNERLSTFHILSKKEIEVGNVRSHVTPYNVTITTIALNVDFKLFSFHLSYFMGKGNSVYLFYQTNLVNFNVAFYMLRENIPSIFQAHKFPVK